jgi:hypothetical protein
LASGATAGSSAHSRSLSKPGRMPVMPRVAADPVWVARGTWRHDLEPFIPVGLTSPAPPQWASAA